MEYWRLLHAPLGDGIDVRMRRRVRWRVRWARSVRARPLLLRLAVRARPAAGAIADAQVIVAIPHIVAAVWALLVAPWRGLPLHRLLQKVVFAPAAFCAGAADADRRLFGERVLALTADVRVVLVALRNSGSCLPRRCLGTSAVVDAQERHEQRSRLRLARHTLWLQQRRCPKAAHVRRCGASSGQFAALGGRNCAEGRPEGQPMPHRGSHGRPPPASLYAGHQAHVRQARRASRSSAGDRHPRLGGRPRRRPCRHGPGPEEPPTPRLAASCKSKVCAGDVERWLCAVVGLVGWKRLHGLGSDSPKGQLCCWLLPRECLYLSVCVGGTCACSSCSLPVWGARPKLPHSVEHSVTRPPARTTASSHGHPVEPCAPAERDESAALHGPASLSPLSPERAPAEP
jgi:hypothetical protein